MSDDKKTWVFLRPDQVPARIDVLMKLVPPCPDWCDLEPDHDADQIGRGDVSRVHWSPALGDHEVSVLMDDGEMNVSQRWYCQPPEFQFYGATPAELASELRAYAASVFAAVEWLEAHA